LRVLVVVAGIVLVLLLATMALIQTQTAKRLAFEQIQKLLATHDLAIEAADFDFSFRPLRISASRIAVHKISSPDLPHFFLADHFSVSVRLKELLYGRYRIEDLQVENPSVHVVIDEQHRDNIPGASGKAATSNQPIDLLILKLRSTGGSFTLEDRSKNLFLRLPVWDLAMDASESNDTGDFQFKTRESSEARYDGKTLMIDSMDIQGALKQRNTMLELQGVHLTSGLGDFALKGAVGKLSEPQLNLSIIGDVHLKPILQLLSVTQNIQGDLHVDASIMGHPEALQLTGSLTGSELTADPFRGIAIDTEFAVDLGTSRARLTSVRARSSNLSASGTADLALAGAAGESEMDARFDVADLHRLLQLYKVPAAVSTRVTGNARMNWPGVDVNRMKGSGRIQLFEIPPTTSRDVPVAGVVSVSAGSDRLTATIDALDSGALHLSGKMSLQSLKHIGGTLRLDISDTAKALPQVAGWFGSSVPPDVQISGPAVINANLGGTLEHPRIDGNVEAKGLRLNGFENVQLDAAAEYTPDQVDIQQFSIRWEAESITGSGHVGLTATSPTLDGQVAIATTSIHRLLSEIGRPEIPVSGNVDVAATVSGTVENPVVAAKLNASDLQAYDEPLGIVSAEASLQNNVALLDTLTLSKAGGGELQASGRYEITSGTYAVDLNGRELQLIGIALPKGPTLRGYVSLTAEGRGTRENPGGVIKLRARDFHVDSEDLHSIDLDVDVSEHQAHITAGAPFYGVAATASVDIASPYHTEAELHIDDADLSNFPAEKLKDLAGRVTAMVKATGNLSDIEGAVVRADVPDLKLDWMNHAISNDKPIQLGYANRELTIFQADLRVEDSAVHLAGNIPLEGSIGQLKVNGSADLSELANLITLDTPVTASGRIVLDGTLRGNLKRMDPDLTITLTNGAVESAVMIAPLNEVNLKAVARDGRMVLEQLTGRWGDARISAQGEATMALLPDLPIAIPRPESPVRLSVDIEKFMLSSMTRPPANTDGTISVRIEAQALRNDISSFQLMVTFPDLKFNAGTFVLEQVGESSIEIRNGIASVRQFELRGPKTNVQLSGTADLRKSGPLDIHLKGDSDAAVLALFSKAARGIGTARLNVDVSGSVQEPKVNGYVEIHDGQAQFDNPRLAAENVQVRLDLNGDRIDVTQLDGTVNGGTVKSEGHVGLFNSQRGEVSLAVTGDGIYLEFPKGLKTVSNAQFRVDGTYPALRISGKIEVEEGAYTEPLTVGRGLMKYFSGEQKVITASNETSDLNKTRLDIALRTLSPIEVKNNIAQGEFDAELRLLGTVEEPGLTGKIEVDEGATLYLRERKYSVDRGLITFNNEHAIEPILDVSSTTTVKANSSDYDITMKISGNVAKKLETDLTSSPPLSESDIVSVLATGRTLNEASSAGGAVAKEQVLSFIAGDLGSSFVSGAGRAVGLNQVRIDPSFLDTTKSNTTSNTTSDPNLIASEADATARLTLGKDITPKLSLVYSMNLRNSSDQIWIADYNVTRRITTSGIRQEDNSFRFQAQHDLLFGLPATGTNNATSVRRKIGSIQFSGDTHLTAEKLASVTGLKTGRSYDFFSVQTARERLEKVLSADDRLEARISVEKKTVGSTVDLSFHIKEGPQVQFVYEGWDISGNLEEDIRKAWSRGVIDVQRTADVEDLIESALLKKRYFGFHIDSSIESPNEDSEIVTFKIQPGSQYDELRVVFEGVHSIKESELQALLKSVGYFNQGPEEREQAIPSIENIYREHGYIDVKVAPPTGQLNEQTRILTMVFRVTEGGLYHFGDIRFRGNAEFTDDDLSMKIKIGPESVFQLSTANKARQILQELYRKTGYSDASVQFSQVKDVSRRIISLTFDIQEGRQRIVREIQVEGNDKTSPGLVRSQLGMESGDILSDEKLSQARTNLYDAGAYAFVDIEVTSLEASPTLKPNQVPVRVVARVREIQPWDLKYGGYYDTVRGPGVITDFSNRNMLGYARVLGVQLRYDGQLREARGYFSQPILRRFPVKLLFSAFTSHEEVKDSKTPRITITDKRGLTPTLEYKFRKSNTLTVGYALQRTFQFTAVPEPDFPPSLARTAPITTSFTRDTRDDPFDASRGTFTSHAVDWGTGTLGSDLHYFKYFGQFSDYLRLGKPTVVPWTHEVRNRMLLAFGARIGILKGEPGQDFRTQQFKSGGGTTVRGFEQDRLGPLDSDGNPTGGDAVLVLNSEFRFPLYKFLDGVAFVDAGNVYPTLHDFSPFDVRPSSGFGIRIRTPYLLLRFDYGINLKTKPGESRGAFFFTFGQAF
jgi:outer membrane protein assembly complex protein YaeT